MGLNSTQIQGKPVFQGSLMVLAVLNPLEWVSSDSPQFIRGRCLDETDNETPICCIRSQRFQRFKTPTRLAPKRGERLQFGSPSAKKKDKLQEL